MLKYFITFLIGFACGFYVVKRDHDKVEIDHKQVVKQLDQNQNRKIKKISGRNIPKTPYLHQDYILVPENKDVSLSENYRLHSIKKGESYSYLSHLYQIPMNTLMNYNGHDEEHILRIGDPIKIPIVKKSH